MLSVSYKIKIRIKKIKIQVENKLHRRKRKTISYHLSGKDYLVLIFVKNPDKLAILRFGR